MSHSSYDDRSSDRRAYDRRYCGSYRRNDYSRERADAYYDADYRHSYEYHRENSSYRSQRSSRRKHRRRRRHSRTFSRSSSVSASPALCPHPLLQPSGTPVSDKYPCAQRSSRAWTQVAAESVCSPGSSLALGGPWHLLWRWMGTGRCEPQCPPGMRALCWEQLLPQRPASSQGALACELSFAPRAPSAGGLGWGQGESCACLEGHRRAWGCG